MLKLNSCWGAINRTTTPGLALGRVMVRQKLWREVLKCAVSVHGTSIDPQMRWENPPAQLGFWVHCSNTFSAPCFGPDASCSDC
jgi:hypothetical protein